MDTKREARKGDRYSLFVKILSHSFLKYPQKAGLLDELLQKKDEAL